MSKKALRDVRGFSLVELAISVTVVGLLVGLAIKGAEMLENAKISSTVLQAKSMNAAIEGFRSEFQAWPGDFDSAQDYFSQCTSGNSCENGDGNGAVDDGTGTSFDPSAVASVLNVDESLNVWKHLLYGGYSAGMPSGDDAEFGSALPSASVGGGFEMFYDNALAFGAGANAVNLNDGHFLRLSYQTDTGNLGAGDGFDGYVAYALDAKIDNGDPITGEVVSASVSGACEEDSSRSCITFMRVGAF